MQISETGYGVDVTARRADDLDRILIGEVEHCNGCTVLDLGCGAGGAAARLVAAGAYVTGIDQHDFSRSFQEMVGAGGKFFQGDIVDVSSIVGDEMFDYVLCQRTLHYVPYNEALEILKNLRSLIKKKLFLSLSGLDSDLGNVYPDRDLTIVDRFAQLTLDGQQTFGIYNPLVLYTKDEAVELATSAGWKIEEVWQSAFGNIKLILRKL